MKKALFLFFLLFATKISAQSLKTTIDNNLLNQGNRGISSAKIRSTLYLMVDSMRIKLNPSTANSTYLRLSGGTITGNLVTNDVVKVGGSSTFESAYLGQGVLNSVTSGTQNTAVGKNALTAVKNGSWNSAFGYLSLATSTSGTKNTGVGAYSLNGTTTGQYNTAIGWEAGKDNTVGYYNTYIGAFKGTGYGNRSGRIWLSDGLGNVRLMIDSLGNVGIGTNSPFAKLHSNGAIYSSVTSNNAYVLNSTGGYYGFIQNNGSDIWSLGYGTSIPTLGTSVLSWNASGYVGIGTTTPTTPFEVVGGQYHNKIATFRPSGTAQSIGLGVESAGANFGASIFQNNVKVFTAESNGGVLIGTNYQESNAPVNGALIEGFLGVGTATPISKLHINTLGSFENYATIGNSNGGIMIGVNEYGGGRILNYAAQGIVFGGNYNSSETEQMRIAASGNVGIGNPAPTQKLDVGGIAQATQFKVSSLNTAPSSSSATGTLGEVRFTATYIYVCTATNTWVRSALATW